jgi:hypothetical protein
MSFSEFRHHRSRMKPISLLLGLCLCIPSCSWLSKSKKSDEGKPEPVVEGPKLVGRIASIPADRRFVLIQSYGKWTIENDRILTTRGPEDRTANLKTTGETLGEFAAADLQSGTVEVGDAVYSQHSVKPAPQPEAPETPQTQGNTLLENVQKNN